MLTALVDVVCTPPTGGSEGFFASPGLLRLGRQLIRSGEEVLYYRHRCQPAKQAPANETATVRMESRVPLPLVSAERVVIAASGPNWEAGQTLLHRLREHDGPVGQGDTEITLVEPIKLAPDELPDYRLARGHVHRQAEIDAVPWWFPPHPWTQSEPAQQGPELDPAALAKLTERRRAAAASLATQRGASLLLNDTSVPLTMERLRDLAKLVEHCLVEHNTLVQFDLPVWPNDLVRDPRVAEHLSLLPLQSIQLLAGSFNPRMTTRDPRTHSLEAVQSALNLLAGAGLSHITSGSVVVGLPGEGAEECLSGMNRAVEALAIARVPRLHIDLYLGSDEPPRSAAEQNRRFLNLHPDWHLLEYCGLFDMAVLLQGAIPGLALSGPGPLPSWEPSPPRP